MQRWRAITEFASAAGLELVFGLNMKADNIDNIADLLAYTRTANLSVAGFELG